MIKVSLTSYGIPAAPAGRARRVASRRSGGFTLLELLLAFVVFALSFATVLEILSGSMRGTVRAREYTEAALTAQSVMDQVGLEIPIEAGFIADGESGDYRWEIDIFAYEGATDGFKAVELAELTGIELLQIDLRVSWGVPPRDQSSEFSTVRAMLANRQLVEQR
jgi:general secretion pathway protein I